MMIAAVIQARIGSQRCKNKMLRNFAGTNLISLALEKYSKPTDAFKLYFAAYEPELIEIGHKYNCTIIERNEESVKSERIEVVMNYIKDIPEETVMFINPCHPFMSLEILEGAIEQFENKKAKSMTAVVKTHTWYYFMDGKPINFLDPTNLNTKTTEPLYQVTQAFHIYNKKRFIKHHYFWTHAENDPCFFETSEKEAIDIDTELDFAKAESLYIREKGVHRGSLHDKLTKIKMLIMDVDGVLTDAGMYYSKNGDELKKFNTRDGMGLALLRKAGIKQAIITGEDTQIVRNRARKLKIDEVHLGVDNKLAVFESLLSKYSLAPDEVAYIGDDINDLAIFDKVGLACSVSDALDNVKQNADYVTRAKGGEGAVREVCELILAEQRKIPK
ncbi:MAG: cytidylyltransferase domain-containing protein [Candidatus Scalindua sp.]